MFRLLQNRLGHYLLLIAVSAVLFLPGLGAPSLWDIDEGNNAECAQEMLNADNWIVPTFNFQLRTDKPAMLYWLQMAAYRQFGINEFAARLPSASFNIAFPRRICETKAVKGGTGSYCDWAANRLSRLESRPRGLLL